MKAPLRFDDAMVLGQSWAERLMAESQAQVAVVRDLLGRIYLAVDGEPLPERLSLAESLDTALGAFSPGPKEVLLFRSDLLPGEVFGERDLVAVQGSQVLRLERRLLNQDWMRPPPARSSELGPKRVSAFGIKGGVGRSTALSILARRFCQQGYRVLVVDLDLESPGLGTTLLPMEGLTEYGVVDWFVEDAVGQADEGLLRSMVETSPLVQGTPGELRVVPAGGSKKGEYVAKLARVYQGAKGSTGAERGFAERLGEMLAALEEQERPDVVLLDSRAGIHDIAAVALTQLHALSLLFAVDTAQSWHAYDLLFQDFCSHPAVHKFRENFKLVAAMVPENDRDPYLRGFKERSYLLFQQIYDEVKPDDPETLDRFNYQFDDDEAPHSPLSLYWLRALQQFDPVRSPRAISEDQLRLATNEFCSGVHQLLFGEPLA